MTKIVCTFIFLLIVCCAKKMLDHIIDSKFYGIMIDESIDILVIGHLMIFATFVEEGMPQRVF